MKETHYKLKHRVTALFAAAVILLWTLAELL